MKCFSWSRAGIPLAILSLAAAVVVTACGGGSGPQTGTAVPLKTALAAAPVSGGTTPVRTCETLLLVTFDDGSKVTSAVEVNDGQTPKYCSVTLLVPDRINILLGLPETNFNGRYQAIGNGVYAGSFNPTSLSGALTAGYAASVTDTGHQDEPLSGAWAYTPTGMNYAQIQDFAYRANHEMALKSKALVEAFYGSAPRYSYWNGCSTGGREGLTEATRYPTDFNGVLAGSPAIHWTRFIPAELWPVLAMKQAGNFLPSCKQNAITAMATAACDTADGLQDGMADTLHCSVDARTFIGMSTPCGVVTESDAAVVNSIWAGPRRLDGSFLWYGLEPSAPMGSLGMTIAAPDASSGTDAVPFPVSSDWFKYFLHKDPTWDWHSETFATFEQDFDQSVNEWGSVLATNNPDLSAFKNAGGKVLIWHGLADPLIFPRGTVDFYNNLLSTMGKKAADQFSRLYILPNVGHCGGGSGPNLVDPFQVVVNWIEQGTAPSSLETSLAPNTGVNPTSQTMTRPACPYPQVAKYTGSGSIYDAASFKCVTAGK
jgi:hypothetical protein